MRLADVKKQTWIVLAFQITELMDNMTCCPCDDSARWKPVFFSKCRETKTFCAGGGVSKYSEIQKLNLAG